jgi:hypothetical protein
MCEYKGVKLVCAMKVRGVGGREPAPSADLDPPGDRFEWERICWDPKDGELCLSRAKPGETLVEARSDSDVQIDRRTWV